MQEVSVTVSPPLVLKEEQQGEEKQRRAQELLHRIHTNKQRVSITLLYLRLSATCPQLLLQNRSKKC